MSKFLESRSLKFAAALISGLALTAPTLKEGEAQQVNAYICPHDLTLNGKKSIITSYDTSSARKMSITVGDENLVYYVDDVRGEANVVYYTQSGKPIRTKSVSHDIAPTFDNTADILQKVIFPDQEISKRTVTGVINKPCVSRPVLMTDLLKPADTPKPDGRLKFTLGVRTSLR